MSDQEIADLATNVLRKMFSSPDVCTNSQGVPNPIGCKHSAWKSDRFAAGSWCFFPMNPNLDPKAPPTSHHLHALKTLEKKKVDSSSDSDTSSDEEEDDDDEVEDDDESDDESSDDSSSSSSSSSDGDTHVEIDIQNGKGSEITRLFYASEAISDNFRGTAHGAYLSGVEQAERIIHLISTKDRYKNKQSFKKVLSDVNINQSVVSTSGIEV